MIQNSSARTERKTNYEIKLCGCRVHGKDSSEPAEEHQHTSSSGHNSGGTRAIEYPRLGITSAEQTLVFGSEDNVTLEDVGVEGKTPFFASKGYLTDLAGRKIPGSEILAALPVDLARLGDTFQWPPEQPKPFDKLPVVYPNSSDVGFARNSFDFGDGSSLVTVGAAIAKTLPLKAGGAMFWVVSCQVVAQGTGKYEGARGIESFSGSSYFPVWPQSPDAQVKLLVSGFKARIHRCIKVVLRESQAGPTRQA